MNPELFCASAVPTEQAFQLMVIAMILGFIFGVAGYKLGQLWKAHNASRK
jgi:hypothetical protein